jgi:hypothetical protein
MKVASHHIISLRWNFGISPCLSSCGMVVSLFGHTALEIPLGFSDRSHRDCYRWGNTSSSSCRSQQVQGRRLLFPNCSLWPACECQFWKVGIARRVSVGTVLYYRILHASTEQMKLHFILPILEVGTLKNAVVINCLYKINYWCCGLIVWATTCSRTFSKHVTNAQITQILIKTRIQTASQWKD